MTLTSKEKLIVFITNAITLYSKKMEGGEIPQTQSIIDFVLKALPDELRSEISMDLIDDVFTEIAK
jgi:hypothetical protein